ncbi:hypothetical protein [Corallococcus sp. CA053C]|uniref:hypothetical protein n=1 Tax=Corallococcus sp. CA053C TaxID=2316732 RepID=UPI0011C36397|nr:hypothetical protein [Corallococcus sp. CA053C]
MSRLGWAMLAWGMSVPLAGCATTEPRAGSNMVGRGAPERYDQTVDSATNACLRNPACYTQTGDQAVLPWLSRAADAARTTAMVMEFLDEADVKRVEQLLLQCARDAERQVNEDELGEGNRPTAEQCNEVVRQEKGKDVTRAMALGTKKHAVALDCVRSGLGASLLRNVVVQPRYKYDPAAGRWLMLDPKQVARWLEDMAFDLLLGTLAPDIVIHESGNPNKVQRVYDYKFPCLPSRKQSPGWRYSSRGKPDQGERYEKALGGETKPVLITPQLGLQ